MHRESKDEGSVLFDQGEPCGHVYQILAGKIRLARRVRESDHAFGVLTSGDLLGLEPLYGQRLRSNRAVALSRVEVEIWSIAEARERIEADSNLRWKLIMRLGERLAEAEDQTENAVLKDAPSRVVKAVLRRAAAVEPSSSDQTVLPMTPLELASRVDLNVDTVKRTIRQLSSAGYLTLDDEALHIHSLANLKRLYHLLGVKEEIRAGFP